MTDVKKTDVDVNAVIADAQKSGNMTDAKLSALLTIMAAKEARIAEKEEALEATLKARDAQRRRDSDNFTIAKIEAQKACRHLKGGFGRQRGQQRDPAVYSHVFTDGSRVIKCNLCQARWLQGDTDEYLTRSGMKIPNWTGIGWRRAQEMVEDSSNKGSSSERFATTAPGAAPKSTEGINIPNLQL
jgi:hypothetical protein